MSTSRLVELERLWGLEQDASLARELRERQETDLTTRVERGIALAELGMSNIRLAPGDRTRMDLRLPDHLSTEAFRGKTGSPATLWWMAANNRHEVDAVVERKRIWGVQIVVSGSAPDHLLSGGEVTLELDAPVTTFKRGRAAILKVRRASKNERLGELREVIFGVRKPEFGTYRVTHWHDTWLNEPQRAAVLSACLAKDLALVHGPPGTGKTRTLVEIIRQELSRGHRVLVTAASNAAVDNLSERLIAAGVDIVRLGHPARVSAAVERMTLDAKLESRPDFKHAMRWMDEARAIFGRVDARSARGSLKRQERREMLREARYLMRDARNHLKGVQRAIVSAARVVCATAAGADSQLIDEADRFDVVVLDEATQCADPITLIPILRADKLIAAGDPHQLPPTVISPEASRQGLSETFFERLVDQASVLTVQYRMHRDIMAFPSQSKYGGRLVAAEEVADWTLDDLGVESDWERPGAFVFVDTAGKGWDDAATQADPSKFNIGNVERTVLEVQRLLARGVSPAQIAVITPYNAQRRRLRAELNSGVEVGTIDAFQGRENDVVIVDLVRSNSNSELGFLGDTRRMNVALTRARRYLLVIGDSSTLGAHPYYQQFLEAVDSHGTWISAWS